MCGVFQARRTDVNADDARLRAAERILRRLPCAASGDENIEIGAVRLAGPEHVVLGTMAIGVLPLVTRAIEVRDRGRIRVPGVEIRHRASHIRPHVSNFPNCHPRPWPWRPDYFALSRAPGRC